MSGIWSGKEEEPRNALEKYAKINRLLVECFADNLKALEAGEQFADEEVAAVVRKAEKNISQLLQEAAV